MGAGKSTLVELVKNAGIPVWDADVAVQMLYSDRSFLNDIRNAFGSDIETKTDMAQLISEHPEYMPTLNNISGPFLESSIIEFTASNTNAPFALMDAPLLFEAGWSALCDFIIAIQCPRHIREERVMKRPGMTSIKMAVLMDRQITEAARLLRSHFIIHNDGDLKDSEAKMLSIIEHLKEFYS